MKIRKLATFAAAMAISITAAEAKTPNLKILSESTTGWVQNFNPWVGGRQSKDMVYEPLVVFNQIDSLKPHYFLATSYALSDDLKALTVNLRKGVKWSDGEDFNADDVVFTFTYPKSHPEIDGAGITSKVSKAEKVDDHTVKLHLKTANAFAANDLLGVSNLIIPEHIWSKIDKPAQESNKNPVGTGPFTEIQRFTPQVYVQCKNPNYWNPDVKVSCLEFPQYSSNDAALELMAKGETDWNGIFIPDVDKTFVAKNENNKYWFPSSDGVRITMNFETKNDGAKEAFSSVNFRKAFNLSMDRDAMMMIGAYGYVTGDNPASNMPKSLWNWRDDKADAMWSKLYRYDIKAAKAELKAGGFKDVDGDGFVENPTGSKLTFKVQVPSGWTDWVNNASIAVEGLRAAGIDANVVTPEAAAYAKTWETGDFDACFCGGSLQSSVWKFYDYTLHSRNNMSPQWWSSSMMNYSNEALDKMIEDMGATPDEAEQQRLASQIEQHVAENVIQVPLYYNGVWYSYNDSRFTGFYSEENPQAHPAPWENYNRLIHIQAIKPRM
ncbi:ABC transporter substrate-binding protein [Endozoicomonas ascidiicola]|uniref:ABC transporter substrate-binding protein n=1 Tax=Endozoicomonas ascidiicola TaxID=1698521 RepID=UPI000AC817E0|nr:ABC transporter substrate-binding protein [Endozoicomonas ascidiicola]